MERDPEASAIPLDGRLDDRRNVRKEPIPYDELPPEIQRVLESRMTKGSRKRTTVEVLDYCLLHELANITIPFGLDNIERKKEVSGVTNGFVGSEKSKKWLDQVMMEV